MIGAVLVLASCLFAALLGWLYTWAELKAERERRRDLAAELVGAYLALEVERVGKVRP